uniref:Uncharacterized protein n=1 Tax=viral metagenome TaxID=1070528 RepID=A0A6M3LTW5_9ZZZZ
MKTTKIDDYTLEVTKYEVVTSTSTYDIDFLLKQKIAIQKSLDDFTVARLAELAEVDGLLAQCEKLGIEARPVEVIDADKI